MDITVEEGRSIETATPGATGIQRRAFGEFVSHRGKMASYAIGWATDADLTAEEARAHDTLPFVWWVADEAMERDRRARWLVGTTSLQTPEVFELSEPILLLTHNEDDGVWQLIGANDAHGEPVMGHLYHAVDEAPTLLDVLDLKPGERAERDRVGGEWVRS